MKHQMNKVMPLLPRALRVKTHTIVVFLWKRISTCGILVLFTIRSICEKETVGKNGQQKTIDIIWSIHTKELTNESIIIIVKEFEVYSFHSTYSASDVNPVLFFSRTFLRFVPRYCRNRYLNSGEYSHDAQYLYIINTEY